ncbi:MAG: type transport system ATP-binding protein, partial [Pseudonocardiales bacterium]|nr:type transport system ATP-binding protein [Pseudonocardiales bacterium]
MSRLSRLRGRWTIPALIVVLAVVAGGVYFTRSGDDPVAVPYKEANIDAPESPDSTQTVTIETRLYLPQQTPAPAIMLAHGFGGSLRSVHTQAEEFARRGFVVLTWSARGFGRSTGQIALNSLDREVRDAQKLLDFLGTRDEVQKDTGGDPRVGVTGASYGGALSLLLAGVDKRVDTIVPVITYNDLAQALLPNSSSATPRSDTTPAATSFGEDGVFKRSWAGIFFSAG